MIRSLIIALFSFNALFIDVCFAERGSAYIFNVGQGNFVLFAKDDDCVVIDCGSSLKRCHCSEAEKDRIREVTESSLAYAVEQIICRHKCRHKNLHIIITHEHADHYNRIADLLGLLEGEISKHQTNLEIKTKLIGGRQGGVKQRDTLKELYNNRAFIAVNNNNLQEKNDELRKNITSMSVSLHPSGKCLGNIQDHNLIVKIVDDGRTYLFMGDAEGEAIPEETIGNIKSSQNISLYVAPHHGSTTHRSLDYLDLIAPNGQNHLPLTVVSVYAGAYNSLPSYGYVQLYNEHGLNVDGHPLTFVDEQQKITTIGIGKNFYSTFDLKTMSTDQDRYIGYLVH